MTHPAVAKAVVFGWPDPALGQVDTATLVGPDADALDAFCRDRLADHKIPPW